MLKKSIQNKLYQLGSNNTVIVKAENTKNLFIDANKILLLRQDRIGDMIVTIPFLSTLKSTYPNLEIDILLGNNNYFAKDLISDYISNFYHYDKKVINISNLLLLLRKQKYDLIIDLFDNPSSTSSVLCKLIKAKYKLGFDKENKNVYTHTVKLLDKSSNHIINRINQLSIPFGIPPKDLKFPNTKLGTIKVKNRVGVNLFGSNESKFIGKENAKNTLKKLKSTYSELDFILFSTPDKVNITKEIAEESGTSLSKSTSSFKKYVDEISKCKILITTDTAAVHLASIYQIPSLVFFKLSDIKKYGMPWYPYGTEFQSIEIENLTDININTIVEKFEKLYLNNQ